MGPRYLFHKASNILDAVNTEQKDALESVCLRVAASQEKLIRKAKEEMAFCTERCRGLCCRNLDLDTVFTLWDFICILVVKPEMANSIAEQLEGRDFYSPAPCPFLQNREGPCIFPPFAKPQLCVVTFCGGEEAIKKEIGRVNRDFYRLCFAVQKIRIANATGLGTLLG